MNWSSIYATQWSRALGFKVSYIFLTEWSEIHIHCKQIFLPWAFCTWNICWEVSSKQKTPASKRSQQDFHSREDDPGWDLRPWVSAPLGGEEWCVLLSKPVLAMNISFPPTSVASPYQLPYWCPLFQRVGKGWSVHILPSFYTAVCFRPFHLCWEQKAIGREMRAKAWGKVSLLTWQIDNIQTSWCSHISVYLVPF